MNFFSKSQWTPPLHFWFFFTKNINSHLSEILTSFCKEEIIIPLEKELENIRRDETLSGKLTYGKFSQLQLIGNCLNKKLKIKHTLVNNNSENQTFELEYPEIFYKLDASDLKIIYDHIFKLNDRNKKWKSDIVQFLKNTNSGVYVQALAVEKTYKFLRKWKRPNCNAEFFCGI